MLEQLIKIEPLMWISATILLGLVAALWKTHSERFEKIENKMDENIKDLGDIRSDVSALQQAQSDTTRRLTEIQSDVKDTNRKLDEVIIPALLKGKQ